jgi:ATPase subunit of ABC transporter with duplicated ATPase domains
MRLDKALVNVARSKIRDQLAEVGFDDARQAEIVGGLSGGWKMKLELARAMLYNADLLLLDEVCLVFYSTAYPLMSFWAVSSPRTT